MLGVGVTLFGRGAKPFGSKHVIARSAVAVVIHDGEIALSDRIACLRGRQIQLHGFAKVLRNSMAVVVKRSQIVGCSRVAPRSRSLVVLDRLGKISFYFFPVFVEKAENELCLDISLRG